MPRLLQVGVVLLVCGAHPLVRAQAPTAEQRVATLLAQAETAKKAGDLGEALRSAREAVGLAPKNRAAVVLTVTLLADQGAVPPALEVYEAYLGAGGGEDREMLVALGRGELRTLARSPAPFVGPAAVSTLAEEGDREAVTSLEEAGASATPSTVALGGLARMGNAEAIAKLEAQATNEYAPVATAAIQAIRTGRLKSAEPTLQKLLKSPDPGIRSEAAEALGDVGSSSAVAVLRPLLKDRVDFVRLSAAAALTHLGDASGLDVMREALASDATHARLTAARALKAVDDPEWVGAALPLLDVMDDLDRIQAAELLLDTMHDHALSVLTDALTSENRVVRQQAARVMVKDPHGHAGLLRRMLRDEDPTVRLHAAGALARLRTIAQP